MHGKVSKHIFFRITIVFFSFFLFFLDSFMIWLRYVIKRRVINKSKQTVNDLSWSVFHGSGLSGDLFEGRRLGNCSSGLMLSVRGHEHITCKDKIEARAIHLYI